MILGPLLPAHDADGFAMIYERRNVLTGEWIKLRPPAEIHVEDIDWLERLWLESDRLDYDIWRASCGTG
jgi:hypothetical protein